jgi:tetratricopeptide (TPR) repeat protein
MTSSGALGAGIFLAVLAAGMPLHAAEGADQSAPTEQQRSEAKARYEAGVAAYTAGHYKDAVDLFLAADRLAPSSPLSFNIARAYEKLGDDSGALRFYRDYLRRTPNAQNANDVALLVKRFEERLRGKGVQQMTVLSTPAGATVALDGAPIGVTPATLDVPPGHHHLALMLRGYADTERDIDLPADHALDVVLELAPAPAPDQATPAAAAPAAAAAAAPAPAPSAPVHAENRGLGLWPYVTLGAGAAALAGALTFELMRKSSEESAKDASTQVEYKDHYDTMVSQRTTARVLVGVGGALVVTGGVLLAIDLGNASPNKKAAARLGIAPTSGGFTGSLAGSF